MINNWKEIVLSQLSLLKKSGLYDECETIRISALGEPIKELESILSSFLKCNIDFYDTNPLLFEFPALDLMHDDSNELKSFYGLYIHTKGVSFPNHSGGKYWRDYMNHYNITLYKEAIKQLNKGNDMCGVKLLQPKDNVANKLHYSGNFFWFKSSYIKTLKKETNREDRFNAEFWACSGSPKAVSLCQLFVDYNTKGVFEIMKRTNGKNIVHTLSYNLPSEVEKATNLIYTLNDPKDFKHYIIDLGFPLSDGNTLPDNVDEAKRINSDKLKSIAKKYGSEYVQMNNIGVSQNWEQVYRYMKMQPKDVLIGADPDEHPLDKDWISAMGEVLRVDKIGLASLMMTDHVPIVAKMGKKEFEVNGVRYLRLNNFLNWALIGMTGEWLDKMGGVPYPKGAKCYGWIEHEMIPLFEKHGYKWVILPDYRVKHTDYELGEPGASKILREWKNTIVFRLKELGYQPTLEEYIEMRKTGKI